MKSKIIITIFSLINLYSYGFTNYTITKDSFISQFKDTTALYRIYCIKENREKVWLTNLNKSTMTINFQNKKQKAIMLNSIKYENGIIEAVEISGWNPDLRTRFYNISDVSFFSMKRNFEIESPYFNIDSSRSILKEKSDSLMRVYSNGNQFIILLKKKNTSKRDSVMILENACYNITFKNSNPIDFGVIKKITKDSIYISNGFNKNMTTMNKLEFKILQYPISEILELRVLKSGGYSFKILKIEDYNIIVDTLIKGKSNCPCWFQLNKKTGAIDLYREYLTERGFIGIKEEDGKTYWYEN